MARARIVLVLGSCLASLLLTTPARGDFIGSYVRIQAGTGSDQGSVEFAIDPSVRGANTALFVLPAPLPIVSAADSSRLLGTIQSLSVQLDGDPGVSFNFSITAGAAGLDYDVTTAAVVFSTLHNPQAYASAALTVTDNDGDGASVTGQLGGKAYAAIYNGATTWTTLLSPLSAGVDGSATASDRRPVSGRETILDDLSSVSSQFKFHLSANDQASGTSRFDVVPEPAALSLLVVGGLLLLRRKHVV